MGHSPWVCKRVGCDGDYTTKAESSSLVNIDSSLFLTFEFIFTGLTIGSS